MVFQSLSKKVFLARAMSLAVLLASVFVAGHVHVERNHHEYDHHGHYDLYSYLTPLQEHHQHQDIASDAETGEIESCFTYHQLQSHDPVLICIVALAQLSETIETNPVVATYIKAGHVLPPARAPPVVS